MQVEDSAVINAVTRFWVIRFRNRSLVITEFFVLIQKFHQLDGIIRQVQGEGRFLDPFNPVFHGERVPVCGGNKGDPLMAQLVQMTETELPCGFVVPQSQLVFRRGR